MTNPNLPVPQEFPDTLRQPSEDLQFTIDFVKDAGQYMLEARNTALASEKLDRTVVTDVDTTINRRFIEAVQSRSGKRASIIGEEESARVEDSEEVWIVDPVDGTGEYVDSALADNERTSCVGTAMLKGGGLQLSVVFNPFKDELFVADTNLGGAFLNGKRLDLKQTNMRQLAFAQGIPYDYSHWDGAPTDARFFEEIIGRPPINSYSAINQAMDVARGASAFDVFPGNTIHDIAPSALMVELAGGVVSDIEGQTLDWYNLNGAVYTANTQIHGRVIQELRARTVTQ